MAMPLSLNLIKIHLIHVNVFTVYRFGLVFFFVYCCQIMFSFYADLGKNKMKMIELIDFLTNKITFFFKITHNLTN